MAVMCQRAALAAGILFERGETNLFSDDAQIAGYAQDAVYSMRSAGVINGVGGNEFKPGAGATRAEAAQIVYGVLKKGGIL
jgi:hypothetical protein